MAFRETTTDVIVHRCGHYLPKAVIKGQPRLDHTDRLDSIIHCSFKTRDCAFPRLKVFKCALLTTTSLSVERPF